MKVQHWDQEKEGVLSEQAMRRLLEQLGYRVTVRLCSRNVLSQSYSLDGQD
jgi:hypothetical protein